MPNFDVHSFWHLVIIFLRQFLWFMFVSFFGKTCTAQLWSCMSSSSSHSLLHFQLVSSWLFLVSNRTFSMCTWDQHSIDYIGVEVQRNPRICIVSYMPAQKSLLALIKACCTDKTMYFCNNNFVISQAAFIGLSPIHSTNHICTYHGEPNK